MARQRKSLPKKRAREPVLPIDRSGRLSPEFKQWRQTVCKPRVRRIIKELPYQVGYLEKIQIERLVQCQFICDALADNIIANSRCEDEIDSARNEKDSRVSSKPKVRPFNLHLQYIKISNELMRSLLITPASKHNMMLADQRNGAFALLEAARKAILERNGIVGPQILPATLELTQQQ